MRRFPLLCWLPGPGVRSPGNLVAPATRGSTGPPERPGDAAIRREAAGRRTCWPATRRHRAGVRADCRAPLLIVDGSVTSRSRPKRRTCSSTSCLPATNAQPGRHRIWTVRAAGPPLDVSGHGPPTATTPRTTLVMTACRFLADNPLSAPGTAGDTRWRWATAMTIRYAPHCEPDDALALTWAHAPTVAGDRDRRGSQA